MYNWPSIIDNLEDTKKKDKISSRKNLYKKEKDNKIKIIYSGNFGKAQDAKKVLEFFNSLSNKHNFKIYLYSKNNYPEIKKSKFIKEKNVIQEYELPKVFKLSNCGMLSLNRNLTSNNIPGKFVSYTQFGLPILCFANKKSTISKVIINNDCGIVIDYKDDLNLNLKKLNKFFKMINNSQNKYSTKSKTLHDKLFNLYLVKKQIGRILNDA